MRSRITRLTRLLVIVSAVALPVGHELRAADETAALSDIERIADELRAFRAQRYFATGARAEPTGADKVIYGPDDRKDIAALSSTNAVEVMAKTRAHSTCLLTSASRVQKSADGLTLLLSEFRQFNLPPCSAERFTDQKVGGWCSGFLVGNDLVATAGHCCDGSDSEVTQIAFIFGFYAGASGSPSELGSNQVYYGKSVVKRRLDSSGDFALIRIDRPVVYPDAAPLQLQANPPGTNVQIGIIGYPSGLPAKSAFGNTTRVWSVDEIWLRTNLDSYAGNSGSVVLNSAGDVIGILVRGATDYKVHNNACFFSNRLAESKAGEFVTRTSVFREFVPND